MNTDIGIVWTETWNRFKLIVLQAPDGFRSLVCAPWDEDARMCNSVRHTLEDAQQRCWGMVRASCELLAAQSAVRMIRTDEWTVCGRNEAEQYRVRVLTGAIGLEGAWSAWRDGKPEMIASNLQYEYRAKKQ